MREEEQKKENEPQTEVEQVEQNLSSQNSSQAQKSTLTLNEAIEFGEYDPAYLSTFAEWHTLSTHIQWELIRKALDIKRKQLAMHYNELCSVLDLRLKSNVQDSIKIVEKKLHDLLIDRERLYVDYTDKM